MSIRSDNTRQATGDFLLSLPLDGEGRTLTVGRLNIVTTSSPETLTDVEEPVYVFVLLISPQDRPGDHLRALENVSRRLRDDGFVQALRAAETRDAIWAILESDGNQRPAS